MQKPDSLRCHLLAAIPGLARNPDRLLVFVDNGTIRSTAAHGLSFEYGYTLNVTLTDFAGDPDAVFVALLAWLLVNQNELLANLETGKDAIKFEADILNGSTVDLSIKIPLTERVIVRKQPDDTLQISHPPEPVFTEQYPAGHWQLFGGDQLLAEWDSAAPTGADLGTPQVTSHG